MSVLFLQYIYTVNTLKNIATVYFAWKISSRTDKKYVNAI
jgi:hypothetical protein